MRDGCSWRTWFVIVHLFTVSASHDISGPQRIVDVEKFPLARHCDRRSEGKGILCISHTALQSHGVHTFTLWFRYGEKRALHQFGADAISAILNVWLRSHRSDIACDMHRNVVRFLCESHAVSTLHKCGLNVDGRIHSAVLLYSDSGRFPRLDPLQYNQPSLPTDGFKIRLWLALHLFDFFSD